MREFETGATRDSEDGKLDFEACLSPFALERFAEYMRKQRHTANGLRADDNWQKGIPPEAYMKSMWRHFHEAWKLHRAGIIDQRQMEDALCGVLFNAQGYLHELLRR